MTTATAGAIFTKLCDALKSENKVAEATKNFSALENNAQRVEFALDLLKKYKLLPGIIEKAPLETPKTKWKQTLCSAIPSVKNRNELIECASRSVSIEENDQFGRHVVAKSNIEMGEIIAVEKPFAHVLIPELYQDHCYHCLRFGETLSSCSKCLIAKFCTDTCQQQSSMYHSYECGILNTLHALKFDKFKLIALRIAILALIGPSDNYMSIHNLCSHTDKRTVADLFNKSVQAAIISSLLLQTNGEQIEGKKTEFFELILRHMQTGPANFHEISELVRNQDGIAVAEEIGAGAYSFLSMINHSCSPNVVRHCYGTTIVLRALTPIEKGQQLFDNYGYHHCVMEVNERRKHLKDQYFFECLCEACINLYPLYDQLPTKDTEDCIDMSTITLLNEAFGNEQAVQHLLDGFLKKALNLLRFRPCRNLADFEECIKQCYSLLANKRTQ